jgi:hypothetical protein
MAKAERGWGKRSFRRTTKRRTQQRACGTKCFLEPAKRPKYPVCSKTSCRPTCGGSQAAFNRARMRRNSVVMRKAKRLGSKLGCAWTKK